MDASLDDTALLVLSREHPEAFGELYERHAEAMLMFFARRTLDPDVAAELTAETFAEAFASRKRFRDRGLGAAAWLYGIARHQLAHFFRDGKVAARARARLGLPRRELDPEDHERVEQLIDLEPMRVLLAEKIAELPEDQREAMRLRVIEERPYAEVADLLGITQAGARQRVSRAMRRLARELDASEVLVSTTEADPHAV
jgi:RNA polymerase sigma-70 factor, ECF subfamily